MLHKRWVMFRFSGSLNGHLEGEHFYFDQILFVLGKLETNPWKMNTHNKVYGSFVLNI